MKNAYEEKQLYGEIEDLIARSCTGFSADVRALLESALQRETTSTARSMLEAMLENIGLSGATRKHLCQSPGFPAVYVSFGNGSLSDDIKKLFQRVLVEGTRRGLLRSSMIHPLMRKNTGDNSGEGVPNMEYSYVP